MVTSYLYVQPALRTDHLEELKQALQQTFLGSDAAGGADVLANREGTSLAIYQRTRTTRL